MNLFGERVSTSSKATSEVTTHPRRDVESWKSFAWPRFKEKYPWIHVGSDGIFCKYCSCHGPRAQKTVSNTFISVPYTGTRPDLLTKHASTKIHEESAAASCESQELAAKR